MAPSQSVDGAPLPRGVQGAADENFMLAVRTFAQMFPWRRLGGGALSVYLDGEPVVDVWTGFRDRRGSQHWTADTGTMVFSATKGVAATVIHRLVDRGLIDYDAPVSEYWRAFAANGKSTITVRDVLRHRSGLSQLNGVRKADLLDHLRMEERLAAAPMSWLHGKPAYHALTFGWLLSGLARAVTGTGMRELMRTEVAEPLGTDGLHLGRPPAGAATHAAQIIGPQSALQNPLFNMVAPHVAALPFSAAFGAIYFPGVKAWFRAKRRCWTVRSRPPTAWPPRVLWPVCTAPSPTAARSTAPSSCPRRPPPRSWVGPACVPTTAW